MPRTRSLAWTELKLGIVSVFAIVMATILIFLLSGEGGFFWQRYSLKTVFPNVAGLKEGAPVRVAGVEVGSVSGVSFLGDRVEVLMEVSREQAPRITSTSTATLGSVSLLGEAAVDITASSQGTPIPEWGYVRTGPPQGSLAEVATQASEGIDQLTGLIADLRGGRGTAGKLIADEALYNDLRMLIGAVEDVASGINQGKGSLGRLMNDPTMARSLEGSLQNLEAVTARIKAGEGSLGRLLNDDAMAKSLTATTANLDTITSRLSRGEGTAGKLFTDQQLYDRLNSMTDRLDKVVASMQGTDGTMGLLLHDKQMYEKVNRTIDEVSSLVAAIKADPRRYLNIRVSLF
jgi:phospholipid/cholesterol/gamma-HCH transport system substrate-binding protein